MSITISDIAATTVAADAEAPWVQQGDQSWLNAAPAFSVVDTAAGFSAKAWLAVTNQTLQLRFEVLDRHHINAPDSVQLWAADGIEIGIDARGDGSGSLPRETAGVMGPDDAKFIVAFTPQGVVGRCFEADRPENTGALPAAWVRGSRNNRKGITVYELTLPWERFETTPGLFPTLGLAVQFNDLDRHGAERSIYNWGQGTFGGIKPGLFNRVVIGPAPRGFSASVVNRTLIWSEKDSGEVVLSVSGEGDFLLKATLGAASREQRITGTRALQRFRVSLTPGSTDLRSVPFSVILSDNESTVLQEHRGTLSIVQSTYRALHTAIDHALDTASHPLFRRHLLSVKAIVSSEWARATLYRVTGERGDARKTFEYIQNVLAGFEDDAGCWETYLTGTRDMYMARISRLDRTVQFYVLSLPGNWDPQKKYPLFVELHGAGNENFLSDMSVRLGPQGQTLELLGYQDRGTYVQREGNGYYIMPSGRGNLGYRGPGEDDVWEAYDEMHRLFAIDENRRYLFGFSMGGGGTWSLGVRTPDRWAALMIMAGGLWREKPGQGLGRNITQVPTFVWCGEDDALFPNVKRFAEEISAHGGVPVIKTSPGIAHSYTRDIQKECAAWLQSHTRTRPAQFTFAADDDRHTGVWGIRMVRDLAVSGLPCFTCSIQDNTVTLTSEGTPGLTVTLGEGGLGLNGEVVVIWNGAESYRGPAETIELGDIPRQHDRWE